jgi:hypothetical protein
VCTAEFPHFLRSRMRTHHMQIDRRHHPHLRTTPCCQPAGVRYRRATAYNNDVPSPCGVSLCVLPHSAQASKHHMVHARHHSRSASKQNPASASAGVKNADSARAQARPASVCAARWRLHASQSVCVLSARLVNSPGRAAHCRSRTNDGAADLHSTQTRARPRTHPHTHGKTAKQQAPTKMVYRGAQTAT